MKRFCIVIIYIILAISLVAFTLTPSIEISSSRLYQGDVLEESETITQVDVGNNHTCALTSLGRIMCWGDNQYGQLGDGTHTNSLEPRIVPGLSDVLMIAVGGVHSCALLSNGDVKCWGSNAYGQVGDNSTTYRSSPVSVEGLSGPVISISAGYLYTCALLEDKTAQCWGENLNGQLGDGTYTSKYKAVNVNGLSGVTTIAAGSFNTCASLESGEVKCWGYNNYGQIGDNTTIRKSIPTNVVELSGAISVSIGDYFSCALLNTHGVKCWGYNNGGRLGDGTAIDSNVPVDVQGLTNDISIIDVGGSHAFAIGSNSLMFWGWNTGLTIGDGSTDPHISAAQVSGLANEIASVATGNSHSCLITTYGRVKCWGENGFGQLGDQTTTSRYTPVEVYDIGYGPYSVSGNITDDIGNPVSGVLVSSNVGKISTSDENGFYSITGLEDEKYDIVPTLTGYRFAPSIGIINVENTSIRNFIIRPQIPVKFLDLPINYLKIPYSQEQSFSIASNGSNTGGRVNSFFDHTNPLFNFPDKDFTRWDGITYLSTNNISVCNCSTPPGAYGKTCYDSHNGIDFQHNTEISSEENVLAAGDGTVITPTVYDYGNEVMIDHHNGYATLYGHLANDSNDRPNVFVKPGDMVKTGDPIGVIGNTGINSQGVHLHFGVYYDQDGDHIWKEDEAVDPFGYPFSNSDQVHLTDPWKNTSYPLWIYSNQNTNQQTLAGGTQTSKSGMLTVEIPPNAISSNIMLEIWDSPTIYDPNVNFLSIGQSYRLLVSGSETDQTSIQPISSTPAFTFAQPITLTAKYTPSIHIDENQLSLYQWDSNSNSWEPLISVIDSVSHTVSAQTTSIGFFNLQAPLLCQNNLNEPNDNFENATVLSVNKDPVSDFFDTSSDIDWFQFQAKTIQVYYIQITSISDQEDPILSIYDSDGLAILETNNSIGFNQTTSLTWTAHEDKVYYLNVSQGDENKPGCNTGYQVSILELGNKIYLPLSLR